MKGEVKSPKSDHGVSQSETRTFFILHIVDLNKYKNKMHI